MTTTTKTRQQERSNGGDTGQALHKVTSSNPQRSFGIGLIAGLAIAIALTFFIAQNTRDAQLDWLFFDFAMPLWIALLGSALIGFVSYPLLVFELHRLRERRGQHKRATERLRRAFNRR